MITFDIAAQMERLAKELDGLAVKLGVTEPVLAVAWRFGGPAAPYALYVHEIPPPPQKSEGGRSARHQVGGWKFLERPLLDAAPGMAEEIAALVRGGMAFPAALRTVAELVMTRMKEATPVEFGTLRNSGHVVSGAAALGGSSAP